MLHKYAGIGAVAPRLLRESGEKIQQCEGSSISGNSVLRRDYYCIRAA